MEIVSIERPRRPIHFASKSKPHPTPRAGNRSTANASSALPDQQAEYGSRQGGNRKRLAGVPAHLAQRRVGDISRRVLDSIACLGEVGFECVDGIVDNSVHG
jgi:hypothetical protein